MNKKDRLLVIIVGFCLIARLLTLSGILPPENIVSLSGAIGWIGAIALMLKRGTILTRGKLFFRLIVLSGFLVVAGSIMKVMHWPAAGIVLLIGLMPIPVWYLLHFVRKKSGYYPDILKLVWIASFVLASTFTIMHWPGGDVLQLVENVALLAALIAVTFSKNPAVTN